MLVEDAELKAEAEKEKPQEQRVRQLPDWMKSASEAEAAMEAAIEEKNQLETDFVQSLEENAERQQQVFSDSVGFVTSGRVIVFDLETSGFR
jgi:hypothetical protein